MGRDHALSGSLVVHRSRLAIGVAGVGAVVLGLLAGLTDPIVPTLGLLAIGAVAIALRHAVVAIGLLIAVITLLPFGVVPIRLGVAPTFLDGATALVWAVWFMQLATGRDRLRHPGAVMGVLAPAVLAIVAYLASLDVLAPDETARTFTKVVVAGLVVVPVSHLVRTRGQAQAVVATIIAGAVGAALLGIGLYLVPRDLAYRLLTALAPLGYPTGDTVLRYRPDTDILRAIGTAIDPNMLGALLMIGGALAVPVLLAPAPPWPRVITVAALIPIAIGVLLTESRGSWLSLIGAILIAATVRHRRLWFLIAGGAVVVPILPPAQRFLEHLLSGIQAQDRASAMRLGELQNALTIIANAPWVGVGWGLTDRSIDLEFTRGVSNIYLTIAQRSGIPTLVAYLGAWVTIFITSWRRGLASVRDSQADGVTLGLSAAIGGALLSGMVDHHFVRFPHLVSLLWVTAGVLVAGTSGSKAPNALPTTGRVR